MGTPDINMEEEMWKMAKGVIKVGNFNMMWDFTQGKTKEQFIREKQLENKTAMWVTKSGRIVIPQFGIV